MTKKRMLMELLERELESACAEHDSYHSAHEGYAVIFEELDELWDEVRAKRLDRSHRRMAEEALQVAATALRFVHDIVDDSVVEVMFEEGDR